jgi:hypothetical protein
LKDKGIPYEVKWSIKARGHAFSSEGRACDSRPKYNVKQKKRIAGNLQTPKKTPPRIVISQKKTLILLSGSRGNPNFF